MIYVAVKRINSGASTIAKEVTKAVDSMVSYLGIVKKEVNETTKIVKLDNYISKETKKTIDNLKDKKLNIITIGDGEYIINQFPLKNNKVIEGSKIFLMTNSKNILLPDFTGWTYNEVLTYASLSGIEIISDGYGYVTKQSVPVDTKVVDNMKVEVTLNK